MSEYDYNDLDELKEIDTDTLEPRCRHCHGRGFLSVESGSSLTYDCPDCKEYDEDSNPR